MARMLVFVFLFFVMGFIPTFIGIYVYRDSKRRGMNPALWTLIAVLSPSFIGFIIYLIVRGSYSDMKCVKCDTAVTEQYTVCPKCGAKLKETCEACNFPVEPDWQICPKCSAPLTHNTENVFPPFKKKDRTLVKILAVIVAIPILLIAFMVVGAMSFITIDDSMVTKSSYGSYGTAEEYTDYEPAEEWVKQCDSEENPNKVYGLRYTYKQDGEIYTSYMFYYPNGFDMANFVQGNSGNDKVYLISEKDTPADKKSNIYHFVCDGAPKKLNVYVNSSKKDVKVEEVDYQPFPVPDEVLNLD